MKSAGQKTQATTPLQPPATGPQLHFQIDRITLHGYTPGAQVRFVNSLKQNLASLAKTRQAFSWPRASRRFQWLDLGQLRPGASPEEAGRHVARQVLGALGRRAGGNSLV